MNARKLLASAAMSATLLMSLTEVAAADETRPPCKQATTTTAARRARAARRPRVQPVVGNSKSPAYMAPKKAAAPVVTTPVDRKETPGNPRMIEPFELSWAGGPAERHVRRRRPGVDELPWGTLDASSYPPELVERARLSWTQGAFSEYCSAAAFAELTGALLAANAPIDLVGMAGDFAADEMVHVELNARVAMELGGGAPVSVDFGALTKRPRKRLTPFQRASEICVRTCCVGEAFSVPMLVGTWRSAAHPLTRGVLERIVKDEAPHARLGWLYLEWAAPRLDDAERARLARVAEDALREYAPYWRGLSSTPTDATTSAGVALTHVHELGWMEARAYAALARAAVRDDIVAPLKRSGISLRPDVIDALLA